MNKKLYISIMLVYLILISSFTFAADKIALNYNIIPDIPNGYVIDSLHTNQLTFSLFETENELYYNDTLLNIENNKFSIPLINLSGETKFTIRNSSGESVEYKYFISNKDGYLEGYTFEEMKNSKNKIYIKTVKNISIIYTEKEKNTIKEIEKILLSLPDKLLTNLKEIKLIPAKHESKAAGITKYNKITLYKLSSYSKATIKNIVIHEIAHTWAYTLMQNKTLDFSYTDYQEVVNKDKKFPSNYAKENVANGDFSEDFAESIAFYLINQKSFSKKFPARTIYIKSILED